MADDILCPTCQHSLAFHKFDYGSCEAPLGGLTSKNMCGCPFTVHTYIQNLQEKDSAKEFDKLKAKYRELDMHYKTCMDEMAKSHTVLQLAQKKIAFLELKLKTVRELLDANKPLSEWIKIGYRGEGIKLVNINEIISELEKDMEEG